jgi:hypothetical protein
MEAARPRVAKRDEGVTSTTMETNKWFMSRGSNVFITFISEGLSSWQ